MADPRSRSVNSLLARFSISAFVVFSASLALAAAALFGAVDRWETRVTPRVGSAVNRLFERQAEEAARRVEEHASSREVAELMAAPRSLNSQRKFADETAHWLARYGYTFVMIADTSRTAVLSWGVDSATHAVPGPLPRALYSRIDSTGTVSGYLRIGDGVMLVGGAAVRAAAGAPARGYLLLGLPVDTGQLRALGHDVSTRLTLAAVAMDRSSLERTDGGDTLVIRQPLIGVFGAPVATIEAAFDRRFLQQLTQRGVAGLLLLLAVGTAILAIAWNSGRRLFVTPVRAIAREMEDMRQSRALHEISGGVPAAEWEVLRSTFNETVRTLHDWQRRYRTVFDRAADALFLLDPSTGHVIDANPATSTLTGVAPEAMIGMPMPAELRPGGPGQRVVRWRRPDGVTQTWGVASSEIVLDGGPWTLAAYRDLTGREAVAHAQKMEAVGSLAGGIAHDFNNLLGAVLTGTMAARAMIPEGHPSLVALDGVEHAGTRAAELTQQLLRFSRHDPLRLAPVDIGHAIETVGRICSRTFDRRIVVDAWVPGDLPAVLGDSGEIEQALLNLCINARDAMPEGGSLRVEARREQVDQHQARSAGVPQPGAYVVVTVADTGTGMTDDVKARLFEPFFTTKETGKGTGLGLSLVYGLMRQMGGAITVSSVPARGTRVTLLFPALAEPPVRAPAVTPASTAAQRPTPADSHRPLILLIDDERALREMLRLVLDLSGFEVLEAADGASGVASLREHQEDVRAILLDVQLPGELSGAETLEQMRAIDPDVPVLLCTGFVREDELARMRMLAIDDVLLKPVDVNALLARLDTLCRTPRRRGSTPAP